MDRQITRDELYAIYTQITYDSLGEASNGDFIRNFTVEVDKAAKKSTLTIYDNPVQINTSLGWISLEEAIGVDKELLHILPQDRTAEENYQIEDYEFIMGTLSATHRTSTVILDTDDPSAVRVKGREDIPAFREKEQQLGLTLPREFTWLDGASTISGTIILPFDNYDDVFIATDPDKDGEVDIVFIPSIEEMDEPKRPYYEKKDGQTFIYVDHFSGGGGSQLNPYILENEDELHTTLRSNYSSHFALKNDITFSKDTYITGPGWLPINIFSGSLDGRGFKIKNLYINRTMDYVGFFGTQNGLVKNLKLDNVNITNGRENGTDASPYYTGGFAGRQSGGITYQCGVTGIVRNLHDSGHYVGGFVGSHVSGEIKNCYSHAHSYTFGNHNGGFAGYAAASIINCFSTGIVKDLTIVQSASNHGGFSGMISSTDITKSCFYDKETSEKTTSAGTNEIGLTTEEMKKNKNFYKTSAVDGGKMTPGYPFDFHENWLFDPTGTTYQNNGYPELRAFRKYRLGKGTAADPFIVNTAEDLNQVRHHLWAHFRQENDIDLSTLQDLSPNGFIPLGFEDNDWTRFRGTYDGNNRTIGNLKMSWSSLSYVALFRFCRDAVFRNIELVDPDITGSSYTAPLFGYVEYTTIENCRVDRYKGGSVNSRGNNSSGFVGYVLRGTTISDCYTRGVTLYSTGSYASGFAGTTFLLNASSIPVGDYIRINRCFTEITIEADSSYAAGFIGYANTSYVTRALFITDCYAYSTVIGSGSNKSGFIGYSVFLKSLVRCLSFTKITSTGGSFAGMIGSIGNSSYPPTLSECYFDRLTTGDSSSSYATPKHTLEMKNMATYGAAGWDFSTIWVLDPSYNAGYPALRSNLPSELPVLGFRNAFGRYHTDNHGNLLKYLEFGTLIAGETSEPKEVFLQTNASFDVEYMEVAIDLATVATGITTELSKTKSPFVPAVSSNDPTLPFLYYADKVYKKGDAVPLYVRFTSTVDVKNGGTFDLKGKASPV